MIILYYYYLIRIKLAFESIKEEIYGLPFVHGLRQTFRCLRKDLERLFFKRDFTMILDI